MKKVIPVDQPGNMTIYLPDPLGGEEKPVKKSGRTKNKKKISCSSLLAICVIVGFFIWGIIKISSQTVSEQQKIVNRTKSSVYQMTPEERFRTSFLIEEPSVPKKSKQTETKKIMDDGTEVTIYGPLK